MRVIDARISKIIGSIDREFRIPVMEAVQNCDGSYLSFQEELSSQVWDYRDLPVQEILDRVAYDVA